MTALFEPIEVVSNKEMFAGGRRYLVDREEAFEVVFLYVQCSGRTDVTGKGIASNGAWGILERPMAGAYAISESHESGVVDGWASVSDPRKMSLDDLRRIFRAAAASGLYADTAKTRRMEKLLAKLKSDLKEKAKLRALADTKRNVQAAHGDDVKAAALTTFSYSTDVIAVRGRKLWLRESGKEAIGYSFERHGQQHLAMGSEIRKLAKSLIEKADLRVDEVTFVGALVHTAAVLGIGFAVWWFFVPH